MESFKSISANVAHVHPTGFRFAHVIFKIVYGVKSLFALTANVSVASMAEQHVLLQRILRYVRPATRVASKLQIVRRQMPAQMTDAGEVFAAKIAVVLLTVQPERHYT